MRTVSTLPNRTRAWDMILEASCLADEHDYVKRDAVFRKFILDRHNNPRPQVWEGGKLDAVNCHLGLEGEKRARGALHAFYLLTRQASTWVDVIPAIKVLRGVPGLSRLRLPDSIMEEIADQIDYWSSVEHELLAA